MRQHGSDCLAPNYRETGRGVANSVNSQQQYPMMQYRQAKERSQSCHEEENRRVTAKQIDAQPDKSSKVVRTRHRQSTVQKATTTFSLRVKQFFYQIHSGCKNSDCHNRLCANGSHRGMSYIILFIYYIPVSIIELGNVTLKNIIIKIIL